MTIPEAVGAFLSRVRRENSFTLDQVARCARSYGATWSASSISNIERGQASLTLSALVLLALALGDLLDRPLVLTELLGDAEALSLVAEGGHVVSRPLLDSILSGGPVEMNASRPKLLDVDQEFDEQLEEDFDEQLEEDPDEELEEEFDEELEEEVLRRMRELRGREMTQAEKHAQLDQMLEESQMPPERSLRTTKRSLRTTIGIPVASLAEERAAKKLGVDSDRLRKQALELWGRPIEQESAARAGAGSTPQARGRMTRLLVEELRASMGEGR